MWVNLAFLFTFFPSALDFLFHSQTQPLAGLAALPLLWTYPVELNRTTVPALMGIGVVIAYICGSLLLYPEIGFPIVANGVTYFMGAIFLVAMWDKLHLLNPMIFRCALAVWTIVGCVQFFPFPDVVKDAFVFVLKPLVSDRFIMDTYSGGTGGRGVILLASEPSISAPTVLYFGLTALFLRDCGKIGEREFVLSLLAVGALAVFNRSGTMTLLTSIALLGWGLDYLFRQPWRRRWLVFATISVAALAIIFPAMALPSTIRGLSVMQSLVKAVLQFDSFHQLYVTLLYLGGQRMLMLSYGYGSLIDNYALGHGIATWSIERYLNHVIDAIGISPIDRLIGMGREGGVQAKPAAYFALIAFDTGLPGLVPLLGAVVSAYTWRAQRPNLAQRSLVFLLPGTAWLLLFITAALISPWMMICYAMSYAMGLPGRARSVGARV